MRKSGSGILLLLSAVLILFAAAPAGAGPLEDFVAAERGARVDRLPAVVELGPAALPALFTHVDGSTDDLPMMAQRAIEGITHAAAAPGQESARAAAERALLDAAVSDAPLDVRRFALRTLSLCAGASSVETLAGLLNDPEMAESARYCLVRCPGDAATAALAAKLPTAEGRLKAGLLTALGVRRAASARPEMLHALGDPDRAIRLAAVGALGTLADPADATALFRFVRNWSGHDRVEGLQALLAIADGLAERGHPAQAESHYLRILQTGEGLPSTSHAPALVGLGRTGGEDAIPVLVDALLSGDRLRSTAAVTGLTALTRTDPNAALAKAFRGASPELQRLILAVVRERKEAGGKPVLQLGLKSETPAVRADAAAVLGAYGDSEDVAALLQALRDDDEKVRNAARAQLARTGGGAVTESLIRLYGRQPSEAKPAVLKVLAMRRDPAATDLFLRESRNRNEDVRAAAIEGLSGLDHPDAVPALVALLGSQDDRDVQMAQVALGNLKNSASVEALEGYLDDIDDRTCANLLGVIGRSDSPRTAEILKPYADSENPAVRAAALNALVGHADEDLAPQFREALMSGDDALRNAGIRGMAAIAERLKDDPGTALRYPSEAMSYARNDRERVPLLHAWAAIGDPRVLPYVEEIMARGEATNEATVAALAIADRIADSDTEKAVAVYRTAADRATSEAQFQTAIDRLRKHGGVDLADYGYVTAYRIAGPFPGRADLKADRTAPPASALAADSSFTVLGHSRPWTEARTDRLDARIDLDDLYKTTDCGAFAITRIVSATAREARLVLGSDDDLVVWLNGVKVHETYGDRGYTLGQDVVQVSLHEGENVLAMKILQGGGGWAFGARVTDRDGQRLRITP